MEKVVSRRLLMAVMWFFFSICSISWWIRLSELTTHDNPIWWPFENASYLPGSWICFSFIVLCLLVLYAIELIDDKPIKLKEILFWVFIFGLGAIFVYPLGTKDIFYYVSFNRLHAFYNLNPHLASVSNISNYLCDPFLKNTYNTTVVSSYGPLWTWLSYFLYRLFAGFGLIPFIISLKSLGLLIHLLITILVYKVAEILIQGNGSRAALIYGMNPLAIFELVANAHNDGIAILFLILSIYLVQHKQTIKGLIALSTAISFKFTAMLAVPFVIFRSYRDKGLIYACSGSVILFSLAAMLYLTTNVDMSDVIRLSTLGFINFSFSSLFYAIAGENIVPYSRAVGLIIFFLWYYILFRKQCKSLVTLNITIGLGFIAYLLFGAYMVHRWYYLWPLALMVTSPHNPWAKAIVTQTIILLPCYTFTLIFGEVNFDKSITYTLSLLPIVITGLKQYRLTKKTITTLDV